MEGSDTEAPSSIETQVANCKFYHSRADQPFFRRDNDVVVLFVSGAAVHYCRWMTKGSLRYYGAVHIIATDPLLSHCCVESWKNAEAGNCDVANISFWFNNCIHSHHVYLLCLSFDNNVINDAAHRYSTTNFSQCNVSIFPTHFYKICSTQYNNNHLSPLYSIGINNTTTITITTTNQSAAPFNTGWTNPPYTSSPDGHSSSSSSQLSSSESTSSKDTSS